MNRTVPLTLQRDSSNMFKRILLSVIAVAYTATCFAADYKVDNNGNVIFEKTIENLPLNKDQIYKAAIEYLENAYKDTKYEIVENSAEKGFVTGQGNLVNFHEQGGLLKSVTYALKFYLRADAKDNRARLRLIARSYIIQVLSDVKSEGHEEVLICDCMPLGDVHKDKGHKKAFEKLDAFAEKTLNIFADAINSATPATSNDDDW